MRSSKPYDELSSFFAAHKTEIPDDGFALRVAQRLPARPAAPLLRYLAPAVGAVLTLAVVLLFGGDFMLEAAIDLAESAFTLSVPSSTSLILYGGFIALLCTVGFTSYYESC